MVKDEHFVTDAKGKPVGVLLELKTYARLRDAEEDLADLRAYDAARPAAVADLKNGSACSLAEYCARANPERRHGVICPTESD
jgi:SH3-like domain-containing protein